MNITQTSFILKSRGITGFDNVSWNFRAPELIAGDYFFIDLAKCRITMEDYENNLAVFVLFRYCSNFKKRINGEKIDTWFTKANFGIIAQQCYDILNSLPDLENWQITLEEQFKLMI